MQLDKIQTRIYEIRGQKVMMKISVKSLPRSKPYKIVLTKEEKETQIV